jgi:hypothetical protein
MIREEWRDIPDVPNYEVSNLGNVRHKERKINRIPQETKEGYKYFQVRINGK